MTTGWERLEELREHLGLSQNQFTQRIGKKRTTYSNWRNSGVLPGQDTEHLIVERWQLDSDSLRGRPGTFSIEPSPALRLAQEQALVTFREQDAPGAIRERLVKLREFLTEHVPELTDDGWAEWLQWDIKDWQNLVDGKGEPGAAQREGAAFLLGWYLGQGMWSRWLQTGDAGLLHEASERQIRLLAEQLARRYDAVRFRQIQSGRP